MADAETYSASEIAAMDQNEIGRHMSGGFGPAKLLKMFRSIQAMATTLKPKLFVPLTHS